MMDTRKLMVDGLLEYIGQAGEKAEYVPIEYLECTGEQYIRIPIKPSLDWRMRGEFMLYNNTETQFFWACRKAVGTYPYFSLLNLATSGIRVDYANGNVQTSTRPIVGAKFTLEQNKGVTIYNGSVINTQAAGVAQVDSDILLGAANAQDVPIAYYLKGRIYMFEVTNGAGTIVRALYPCLRLADMKPGMLDNISGKFYENAGTGEFTYVMPPYAENPDLWIEADSAGSTAWTNKGVGGYDLLPYTRHNPVIDGSAITASSGHLLQLYTYRNVVGTGSFTIDAVVRPSSALASTSYGGWLYEQRTDNTAQAGSIQCTFSNTYKYSLGGWGPGGASILSGVTVPVYAPDRIQYVAAGYDAGNKRLWMQLDDTSTERNELTFSCTIPRFEIGFTMWNYNVPFMGSLYSIRVYNRVLTTQELAYNRARDRLRFNF